jgi:hypothetical protein
VAMTRIWERIKRLFRIGGDGEPAPVRNVPPQPLLSGAVALPISARARRRRRPRSSG